jgi:hypothetical protein
MLLCLGDIQFIAIISRIINYLLEEFILFPLAVELDIIHEDENFSVLGF